MRSGKICGTCLFWTRHTVDEDKRQQSGRCEIRSPTFIKEDERGYPEAYFKITWEKAGCGEWRNRAAPHEDIFGNPPPSLGGAL